SDVCSSESDYILSNSSEEKFVSDKIELDGTYGVVTTADENLTMLLGAGKMLSYGKYILQAESEASVAFEISDEGWFVSTNVPACLSISIADPKAKYELEDANGDRKSVV